MRPYATAQNLGDRSHQCDATAVATVHNAVLRELGALAWEVVTAYVLLDGIGSNETVREWTRDAAAHLALTAAQAGDAESGLRTVYEQYATEPNRSDPFRYEDEPMACAVVAVVTPGKPTTIAWCGDARAYAIPTDGPAIRLTQDHNLRRVWPPRDGHRGGNRNVITSCLGASDTDEQIENRFNHPVIETHTLPPDPVRLLLASDGAYEPYEDAGRALGPLVSGAKLGEIARRFVDGAVKTSRSASPDDPYADNATVLIADIPA
ncbi:PP2C family protein-serine/threonine phosphatase [Streptomyces roseoviridis]|uniref:PP2C family protein-serine/threonine phosphatase n=1 Tax=Streptomyces roseoviridis TaxID=67361 RepID=A0ABV5QYQ9_9ACTN